MSFNQEKALVGAFSVIVKTGCGTDGALHSINQDHSRTSHPGHGVTAPALVRFSGPLSTNTESTIAAREAREWRQQ